MKYKLLWDNITLGINKLPNNSLVVLFAAFCLVGGFTLFADALPKAESPKDVIEVKDFKWRSGGMGMAGIIKEITLDNKGKMTYKNIEIEVELYTNNDIPLGSLRSTIHNVLEGGSEKTFYNVNFGIMHSELEKTAFRVTGAELVEKGPPSLPKDLILVKNWEWSGAQYGTEGILKEITLENRSDRNYKDIKIMVGNLGVGDSNKVGYDGYTSRAVIHDVLPAKSTKTFKDINVGFKHPATKESYISVIDAKLISAKELRYRLSEKGVRVKKKTKKVAKKTGGETSGETAENESQLSEKTVSEEESKLTLAERYRQKLSQKTEETSTPQSPETAESSGEIPKETESQEKEVPSTSSEKETAEDIESEEGSSSEDGIIGKVSKLGKSIVGIFKDDSEEIEEEAEEAETSTSEREESSRGDAEVSSTEGETTTVLEIPEEEEEEEVAIPKDDIIVKDFKWGGGVTGTIGTLEEITLENRSGINYRNIQLAVEFFGGSDRRPLGSNKITIYGSLPANSEKVFRNVKIGFLNSIPEDVVIRAVDATAVM
ncbi:MAG: hypothetical protein HYW01_11515 [Deltaproteobacteria bacterium]|nr:hypothetical protein [Deltaproteobacteria bacterium]